MQQKRDNSTRNGLTDEVDHGEMYKKNFRPTSSLSCISDFCLLISSSWLLTKALLSAALRLVR